MNKIICSLLFVAIVGAYSLVIAQDTGRGGTAATWQVQRYDLEVGLPTDNSRTATVKAVLAVKNVSGQPASSLTLRISPLAEISAIRINDAVVDFAKSQETVGAYGSLQRAAIRIPSSAPGSTLTAVIDYKIKLSDNSGVSSITPAAATFLPLAFWYPTPNSWFFPKGADHAQMRIRVNAPNGQTVVSSGVETAGVFDQKLYGQPFFVTGGWENKTENGVTVYMPIGTGAEGQKRAA